MRNFFLLAAMVLTGGAMKAQTYFGVHGGLHLNYLKSTDIPAGLTNDLYSNALFGAFVQMQAGKKLAVQPEINFYKNKVERTTGNDDLQMNYVQVPVLLKFQGKSGLNLLAGPYVAFLSKAESETASGVVTDIKNSVANNDFGAVAGLEYVFKNGIVLGGRYVYGISEVLKVESQIDYDSRHRAVQFTAGYMFGHRHHHKTKKVQ
jgi:hypothetical protein